ncbi:hypothetical protein SUBVAR_05458 [Subdoligranulum variabile DSM 15176]|uniref:Uncharacterized protein n=1 Tax=Subdoligranulum variabile DSM 15176 TaxID=411471 RepID=D1PM99_9FIRM|nr:hypothetical protein SUBVAR_05458 [Subdoligranulum variabile DSM 15176]
MFWNYWRKKGKTPRRMPPAGMTADDIRTQSSVCTGETMIGFWDSHTGRLQQAVVVRNDADIAAFYRSYGWEPPCGN